MNNKSHKTVLLSETIKALSIKQNGIYVDGTFGSGGHSLKILKQLGKYGRLYAIDKDPYAINIAKNILDSRFKILHGNFSDIDKLIKQNEQSKKIDGVILDLGVSTMQLLSKERGFSFNLNGPLDMRMNPNYGISASEWINNTNKKNILFVLKTFGEEKFATRIANKIENIKKNKPILTTKDLSNIIKSVVPNKYNFRKHPATKSFQAIRIFINKELYELEIFLQKILNLLNHQAKICIISFHSLEDRLVKQFMKINSGISHIPYGLPISENQIHFLHKKKLKNIHRIFPKHLEIQKNHRSRSAILRTAEFQLQ